MIVCRRYDTALGDLEHAIRVDGQDAKSWYLQGVALGLFGSKGTEAFPGLAQLLASTRNSPRYGHP